VLANGLSVLHVPRPSGVVSTSIVVRGGASSLGDKQSGLAAFTVRMLTEGTKDRTSLELSKDVEALGTALEHEARRDVVRLGISTLREDFERGLSLLADVARNPAFAKAEIARVRAEWLDSIDGERQDPARLASLAGFRLLLGPRAGAPVAGSRADVARFGEPDLRRFHRERFVPKNAALVVVGDLSFEEVMATATRVLGNWTGGASPAEARLELPPPKEPRRVVLVDRPSAVQSAVFVARPMPTRAEPGFEARAIMNGVVGGLFTSRLNTNLRETHGYTYGVRSTVAATRAFGAFIVMTSVRTDATAEALREIFSELEALRDPRSTRPITEEEIARARAALVQQTAAGLQRTASVRDDVETLFTYSLGPDYLTRYPKILGSLDRTAIRAEAERLVPDQWVIVVVGDRTVIEKPLRDLGFLVEMADAPLLE
jgi:zinc protease